MSEYNLITVLGHTAGGKTRFAACLADSIGGELVSADSRQVYRRMSLGTGKDYEDYVIEDRQVPYHLVDILEPGSEYNVYEFQKDFLRIFQEIQERGRPSVLCGGSGLYIEAVLKGYRLIRVPANNELRKQLESKSMEELGGILASFKKPHNVTDTGNRKRLLRALEIEYYYRENPALDDDYPEIRPLIFGINFDRDARRKRISQRLSDRLKEGMVEEVEGLLGEGIPPGKLIYYGLEYKYITEYLQGKTDYEGMVSGLETAIHQFAKRQMTWFRGMERRGFEIYWIDGHLPLEEKLELALEYYRG
ncbi:MAG TPA: tRNA (adenosine(37)-N6)-dimethylallyltransferase MiaA [Bacteroides sp.]|nr:tRNA (adenosine(37)-N6)-dimethylallyltransferase MiaA [Bacteroides sp.]